jgi:very-short-patch-repair endonuclease
MLEAEYNLKRFCALKGILITKEKEVQYGKQFTLKYLQDNVSVILFPNNNLVQGIDSYLKEIISAWAGKAEPGGGGYYIDLPSGWREWNEEARWINEFHTKNGVPKEEALNHRYMINREVLFHDYMFRNGSLENMNFEKFEQLVRAWFKRNCFMNLNINFMLKKMKMAVNSGSYMFTEDGKISFSLAAELLAKEFSDNCSNKYYCGSGKMYCPQTEKLHDDCLLDIVDALFPYFSESVLSYTKENLNKLIKYDYDLKWTSIKPSTPIEEKMSDALISAGILSLPQYQAWDDKHRYNIDFLIKTPQGLNIAVECDGLQFHARPSTYIKDRKRDRYLQNKGFYMMRFSSVEIFNEIDSVITEIDKSYWKIQKKQLDIRAPYRLSYFGYGEQDDE